MKKTMTNKTTTSYSALADRDYTRKVYPLNNSVNYYRPRYAKKILASEKTKDYFAMQKTRQVKKIKEDALYKSSNIESVGLSSECTSDEIHARIDSQNLISSALSQLDDRKKTIIQMRYAIGYDRVHTKAEIARKFNICQTYVATLEHIALHKMRRMKTLLEVA